MRNPLASHGCLLPWPVGSLSSCSFESCGGGGFPVDWRDTLGEYISQSLNCSAVFFEGFKVCILGPPNQRCYQQQKGPVRLSARDPFERFSTLLTRLQSQQISGMQSYSARYKYSGIRTYFNNLFGGASPSGLKFLVEIFWRSGLLPLSFYKQTKHPTD